MSIYPGRRYTIYLSGAYSTMLYPTMCYNNVRIPTNYVLSTYLLQHKIIQVLQHNLYPTQVYQHDVIPNRVNGTQLYLRGVTRHYLEAGVATTQCY